MKCVQNAEKCAFLPLCVCVCVIIYTYVYILLYVEKHPRFHWFQPKTVHLVFYINVFFSPFFLASILDNVLDNCLINRHHFLSNCEIFSLMKFSFPSPFASPFLLLV